MSEWACQKPWKKPQGFLKEVERNLCEITYYTWK